MKLKDETQLTISIFFCSVEYNSSSNSGLGTKENRREVVKTKGEPTAETANERVGIQKRVRETVDPKPSKVLPKPSTWSAYVIRVMYKEKTSVHPISHFETGLSDRLKIMRLTCSVNIHDDKWKIVTSCLAYFYMERIQYLRN